VALYSPKIEGNLDDLSVPATDLLKQLPGVQKVEVLVAVEKPKARIVHVANWHPVPKELFDVDLEHDEGRKITGAELDDYYAALLEIEIVQTQQLVVEIGRRTGKRHSPVAAGTQRGGLEVGTVDESFERRPDCPSARTGTAVATLFLRARAIPASICGKVVEKVTGTSSSGPP
jgi:hypothetical protein